MTMEDHANEMSGQAGGSDTAADEQGCGQCKDARALYLRAMADYQNLQKEVSLQRAEWVRMSEAQILVEFLPVYNNFRSAFRVQRSEGVNDGWAKGIEYIMKQFGDVLKAHGVEEIQTVGEPFDPAKHEAVGEEEGGGEPGTIVKEVDAGYAMKGKVLKTAKVIVAK